MSKISKHAHFSYVIEPRPEAKYPLCLSRGSFLALKYVMSLALSWSSDFSRLFFAFDSIHLLYAMLMLMISEVLRTVNSDLMFILALHVIHISVDCWFYIAYL